MAFRDPHGAHRRAGIPLIGATWRDRHVDGDDIAGVIFQDCTLERVRLTRTSLWQTMFVNCHLDDCEFEDCRLFRTQFVKSDGSGLRIHEGEFAETAFSECGFERVDVESAGNRVMFATSTIGRLAFTGAGRSQHGLTISDSTFDEVAADGARWQSATAVGADFACWSLAGAVLERCLLVEATASGLDLASVQFNQCNLFKGDFRKARIRHAPGSIFAECACEEADFAGAELTGALFAKASAVAARFTGAVIDNAMFPQTQLARADFSGATAKQCVWTDADLTEANLERLDAWRGSFRNGVLKDARLDGARLVECDLHGVEEPLAGADCRGARGTIEWRAEREADA